MFKKLFGNFKNIGSKIKSGWNLGKKIFKDIVPYAFTQLGETIRTFKSIEDPIEKQSFKEQIGDLIGDIPSKILLNPITEFLVSKKEDNNYVDNWED
jgi:hypothetical protein